jgi:hypothetical protein
LTKNEILTEGRLSCHKEKYIATTAKHNTSDSIILHRRISEIENTVILIVSHETQCPIAKFIEKSFYLCAGSERLLREMKEIDVMRDRK